MNNETWQRKWSRRLALMLLFAVVWATLASQNPVCAADPAANANVAVPVMLAAPDPEQNFFMQILSNLFNSRGLMRVLGQPEFTLFAFIALNLIVFVETGLLIGFFLPGDSLLVTAGIVCAASGWNLPLLLVTLSISAIVGDSIGYSIGYNTGPRIFNREKSFFFHKEHLLAAQKFYEQHGGKTIILARFMPIIRTFAPVVAGVGKMDYRRFLFFNIFGGIGWVVSMILIGYFLENLINPLFRPLLGEQFDVQDHVEKVIIVVVLLSVAPGGVLWLKKRFSKGKPAPQPELAAKSE